MSLLRCWLHYRHVFIYCIRFLWQFWCKTNNKVYVTFSVLLHFRLQRKLCSPCKLQFILKVTGADKYSFANGEFCIPFMHYNIIYNNLWYNCVTINKQIYRIKFWLYELEIPQQTSCKLTVRLCEIVRFYMMPWTLYFRQ